MSVAVTAVACATQEDGPAELVAEGVAAASGAASELQGRRHWEVRAMRDTRDTRCDGSLNGRAVFGGAVTVGRQGGGGAAAAAGPGPGPGTHSACSSVHAGSLSVPCLCQAAAQLWTCLIEAELQQRAPSQHGGRAFSCASHAAVVTGFLTVWHMCLSRSLKKTRAVEHSVRGGPLAECARGVPQPHGLAWGRHRRRGLIRGEHCVRGEALLALGRPVSAPTSIGMACSGVFAGAGVGPGWEVPAVSGSNEDAR